MSKILELSNKSIPIYKGSVRPLIEPAKLATEFHGQDGMADTKIAKTIDGYLNCIQ